MNSDLTIGKYNLVRNLGEGAFSKVYKATDDKGNVYAIKVLRKTSQMKVAAESFVNEMKVMSKLSHPNVLKYYGGEIDGLMTKHSTGETRK